MEDDESLLEGILDGNKDPTDLPLALLQKITNNFSKERKLGQGGFGAVYKGVSRKRIVAVKKIYVNLENIDDDDKQFGREFNSLWNTNHQNVVRFLGFCSNIHQKHITKDGKMILANVRERLFCFEYISNGSLDKHITDELRGLEWKTRYEIITGICEGLRYLHEEKEFIHMDLKPANILLDHQNGKYIPKITDFGLSRPNTNSHTVGQCYGTLGYWAPENRDGSKTIYACDIYGLGAIIMELVTGDMEVPDKQNVLRRWRHRWSMPPTPLQYQQVTRCIEIALRCREQGPEARPSIKEIIDFLSKPESMDVHTGQEISTYMDNDMLGIEPLELHFNKEMPWSVKLTNKTNTCFAFNIEGPSKQYTIWPKKGIVTPGCKEYLVQITLQPREWAPQVTQNANKFVVWSTTVSNSFRPEDIAEHTFHKEGGKVVDEVDLMVVSEPVEAAVPPKKAIISSSYEDGTRRQLDRCNFHPPERFSHSQATNMTYLLSISDRAIDVTRGAMGSLLHKLGVLQHEFNLETSVKEDVKSLSKKLVNMQQVLRKVSDVQQANLSDLVKHWACNVREMSYDLEDFVDGFLVHSEPDSDGSGFRDLTHEMCFLLEKGKRHQPIGDLIKHHISKQVQDEAQQQKESNVDTVVAHATTKADINHHRVSALYEDKELLVGIETPRNELISLFEEAGNVPKGKLGVVSIVGMGGLGKTTLANAVYKNLKAQYGHKTLISVGQNPDVEKVLTKIIRKLNKNFCGANLDVEELIEELRDFLEDKRYFIVIDDIWDSEVWGLIGSAFPGNNHGSRVITTTRIEDVAHACCRDQNKNVYRMKPLSEEDSGSLFLRKIFGPGEDCPDALKDISIDILKKCGGMPLANNSIASLLVAQPRSTWDYVRKTLGAMVEENPQIGNMKQILYLSYIHLPDHLKTCLLYICKYREDEEIDKNDLLRQWVAEGFVVSKNGMLDADDVAEKYFKALINMCMIEPGKKDYNDEVLSFRVHDIMLELIRSKAKEENFIHVIDGLKDETGARGKIRRVSVHQNGEDDSRIVATMKVCSHVRSVLLYRASPVPYFLVFKYVRVLHFQDVGSHGRDLDVTSISRLFLLRYLKIEGSYGVLRLPDQIGELQQLETIALGTGMGTICPSDIVSLPWLSHLNFGKPSMVLPDGIGRMKSLRILEGVDVLKSSVENIKGLGELINLRKLSISSRRGENVTEVRMDVLHSSICKLSASLRTLSWGEGWSNLEGSPRWISNTPFPQGSHSIRELNLWSPKFQRCPQWIGQLRDLCSLYIVMSEVADGVSIVAGLPSLAYFCLNTPLFEKTFHLLAGLGEAREESVVISGSSGAFQALKHLEFRCPNSSLIFEAGAMPKLEKLNIMFRYHMARRYLPVGIGLLQADTLKEISLSMDEDDGEARRIGLLQPPPRFWEEYYNESHQSERRQIHVEHIRRFRTIVKRAFKLHYPSADIVLYTETGDDADDHNEDYASIDDEADCCNEDFGRMSVNTDVPLMVDMSPYLAVGSDGRQSRHTKDLVVSESFQLPSTNPLVPSPSSLDVTLALCWSSDTAEIVGDDLNQATNELNDGQFLEFNEDVEPTSISSPSCIHAAVNLFFIVLLRIQAACNSCLRS